MSESLFSRICPSCGAVDVHYPTCPTQKAINDFAAAKTEHPSIPVDDTVDRPAHYGGTECIEAMQQAFGKDAVEQWCKITAFKYLWRAGKKPGVKADTDTAKAQWYLNYSRELRNS